MCTNFIPSARVDFLEQRLGPLAALKPQEITDPGEASWPAETFPGYAAPVVVRAGQGAALRVARFGLVPPWSKDAQHARELSRGTYNARSETAAVKPSFRHAWAARQWALVPMACFFEPCWEDAPTHSGRPVRWKLSLQDGQPFAVAGLWERWGDPAGGEQSDSFTLLTVNADSHPLMNRMHRPGDEKRMPVIVPAASYAGWLQAGPQGAQAFMQPFPAEQMRGEPSPLARAGNPSAPAPHNLSLF